MKAVRNTKNAAGCEVFFYNYMSLTKLLEENHIILTEASVIEKLRRSAGIKLHPRLENSTLLYDGDGERVMRDIYRAYIDVACKTDLPIITGTPTWRANRERVQEANIGRDINGDAVRFLKNVRNDYNEYSSRILIGGLIGCKNDCYKPEEGLQPDKAYSFHSWQIEKLAKENIDYLLAATVPALPEALGMALAMEKTRIPYFISFVINRAGKILDGSSLRTAFDRIDAECSVPPIGYMINCAYPSFLKAHEQSEAVLKRLLGFQANASSLDHDKLDGAVALQSDSLEDWGNRMIALNKIHGIKILGGCCGTDVNHLKYIVNQLSII